MKTARCRKPAAAMAVSMLGALILPLSTSVASAAPTPVRAHSADAFVSSVGVGTHLTYGNEYANKALIEARIVEAGIRRIRASWSPGDTANRDLAVRLGQRGVKIMFWTGQIGSDLEAVKRAIKETNALAPGTIDAIEGPNEQDNHPGLRAFVQQYASILKADPVTAGLRVYGPSLANVGSPTPYTALGDISQWVDAANVHNYPGGRMMSDAYIDSMYSFTRQNVGATGGLMSSELGYSNATGAAEQPHPAVPLAASAVLIPRLFLEHYRRGLSETYVYELINQARETPWEANFGLLNSDFSPKPAFTAIKNLNNLLADPGPTFTPGSLAYELTGTDSATRQMLLQKRDGTFWLALWQQNEIWDRVTKQWTGAKDIPVTLTLPGVSRVTTYRPVASASAQATTQGTIMTVPSGVSPTLVQIKPDLSTAPTTPVATPTAAPTSSASPVPVIPTLPPLSPVVPVAPATSWATRINSGGAQFIDASGSNWSADAGFTGGTTFRSSTSGLSSLAADSRFGSFGYEVRVPAAGKYRVRVHSTETYWTSAGARIFSAKAEGQPVMTNIDLFTTAGKDRTVVREVSVTVTDGSLSIALESLINFATVDGLEVIAEATALPTIAPTPTAPQAPWATYVNSGGPRVIDASGRTWNADEGFSGGTAYKPAAAPVSPVPAVSANSRFGSFTYSVPVPRAGTYLVRVHTTETFWSAPRQRVFSITAEGLFMVRDLDLVATVGKGKTSVIQLPVRVADGALTLTLDSLVNYATIDGFEVVAQP